MLDPIELIGQVGMFRLVAVDAGEPGVAQLLAAAADALAESARRRRRARRTWRPRASRSARLVSLTSSSPSGSPWAAFGVLLVGAPQPMWLSTMIRVGRSVVF